jgi:hypothetical protein
VMGAACLACAAPMVTGRGSASPRLVGRRCIGRAAGHLLIMSTAMILIHLVLLTAMGAGTHHHQGPATVTGPFAFTSHDGAMLALIGVELLCLVAASAALRMTRAIRPQAPAPQPVPLSSTDFHCRPHHPNRNPT